MSRTLICQSEGREIDWKVVKASLVISNGLYSRSLSPSLFLLKKGCEMYQCIFLHEKLSELTSKECLLQLFQGKL